MERWGLGYERWPRATRLSSICRCRCRAPWPAQGLYRIRLDDRRPRRSGGSFRPPRPRPHRNRHALPRSRSEPGPRARRGACCSPPAHLTGRGRMSSSRSWSRPSSCSRRRCSRLDGRATAERRGNRVATHSPSGVFRCSGHDDWCAIAARTDAEWTALCAVLERSGLADDEVRDLRRPPANENALEAEIGAAIRRRNRGELAQALQASGVPPGPCSPE